MPLFSAMIQFFIHFPRHLHNILIIQSLHWLSIIFPMRMHIHITTRNHAFTERRRSYDHRRKRPPYGDAACSTALHLRASAVRTRPCTTGKCTVINGARRHGRRSGSMRNDSPARGNADAHARILHPAGSRSRTDDPEFYQSRPSVPELPGFHGTTRSR